MAFVFTIGLLLWGNSYTTKIYKVEKSKALFKKSEVEFEAIKQKKINPSGTHLVYKLLSKYRLTQSIKRIQTSYFKNLTEVLPLTSENEYPNVYVSVNEVFNLEKLDNDYLFDFVSEGNYAIVSAENFNLDFIHFLLPNSDVSFYVESDTSISLNYAHPNFRSDKIISLKNADLNYHLLPKYKKWVLFNPESINDDAVDLLYFNGSNIACLKIDYGKGSFIFHTLPDAFSNSFLTTEEGKNHAEIIFSHIPKGNYFWHENFGKYSTYRGDSNPEKLQKPKEYSKSSPLQFILSIPSLKFALFLSMVGLLLYLMIKSKRKQRVIPLLESDRNTSLEFIEVIAKLYQQQNQHSKIIRHIEINLNNFIKQRYYIHFTKIDEKTLAKIVLKSGVDTKIVGRIYKRFESLSNKKITDEELIEVYKLVEQFHKERN